MDFEIKILIGFLEGVFSFKKDFRGDNLESLREISFDPSLVILSWLQRYINLHFVPTVRQ